MINVFFLGGAIAWLNNSDEYIQWGPNDDSAVPPRPVTTSEGRKWWFLGDNWVSIIYIYIYIYIYASSSSSSSTIMMYFEYSIIFNLLSYIYIG
eukprot:COSAG06_NODE_9592_length_1863_cov_6.656463_2_plen_94_part_00